MAARKARVGVHGIEGWGDGTCCVKKARERGELAGRREKVTEARGNSKSHRNYGEAYASRDIVPRRLPITPVID